MKKNDSLRGRIRTLLNSFGAAVGNENWPYNDLLDKCEIEITNEIKLYLQGDVSIFESKHEMRSTRLSQRAPNFTVHELPTPKDRPKFKIEYKTFETHCKNNYVKLDYEILNQNICCDSMKTRIEEHDIHFSGDIDYCRPKTLGMYISFTRDEWDGVEIDYYPITFCPFCGAAIELIEKVRSKRRQIEKKVTRTITDMETTYVPYDDGDEKDDH